MILNLNTGQTLTVDEVLEEMAANRGESRVESAELRHADDLVSTLVQERDELRERVETLQKMLAAERYCKQGQAVRT